MLFLEPWCIGIGSMIKSPSKIYLQVTSMNLLKHIGVVYWSMSTWERNFNFLSFPLSIGSRVLQLHQQMEHANYEGGASVLSSEQIIR